MDICYINSIVGDDMNSKKGFAIAGDYTTDYNLASYTTGASLIGQFIIRNDGPIAKVGVFRATSTSVTLKFPSGRLGYIVTKS